MERLQIRKRREITQKQTHPIREAMPTLLLAMALLTSPTTVIATNDRYDTASLSPTRSARSRRSSALSPARSAATSLQPTNPVETECGSSPAAQPETSATTFRVPQPAVRPRFLHNVY